MLIQVSQAGPETFVDVNQRIPIYQFDFCTTKKGILGDFEVIIRYFIMTPGLMYITCTLCNGLNCGITI